jgi:hypothetical protein
MKAKIIRGTTLRGALVNEGEIVELDSAEFNLLRIQKQAVEHVEENKPSESTAAKKGK